MKRKVSINSDFVNSDDDGGSNCDSNNDYENDSFCENDTIENSPNVPVVTQQSSVNSNEMPNKIKKVYYNS